MKTMIRQVVQLLLIVGLALPFAACKKEAPKETVKAPLTAPANGDINAWRAYVSDVVQRNMGNIVNQPYVYFLPPETAENAEGAYERMLEKAKTDVARGIISGNMLAYASPDSAKMADIVVESFKDVPPGTMKGVRVLFIGKAADNERVKAAVEPAGVTYVFIET